VEQNIDAGEDLEIRVTRWSEAAEELPGHGPDRWGVVPVVLLHAFPVAARCRVIEPVDIFLERLPAVGREVVLALAGIAEDVRGVDGLDEVDAQIAKLALVDGGGATELRLGDHRALVEPEIAELLRVLRPEVVMIKLVPVVVLVVPDVRV